MHCVSQGAFLKFERAVFLTHRQPTPIRSGTQFREVHLVRLLQKKMEVDVLYFENKGIDPDPQQILNDFKAPVSLSPCDKIPAPILCRLVDSLRPEFAQTPNRAILSALKKRKSPNTLVWASRTLMASYIPIAKKLGYTTVLDEMSVETSMAMSRISQSLVRLPKLFSVLQGLYYERLFCVGSDAVVASSELDASRISKLSRQSKVFVLSNAVNAHEYAHVAHAPLPEQASLLFTGNLNTPANQHGLKWFVSEVLPRLKGAMKKNLPEITVAGANPPEDFKKYLQQYNIKVVENPPSIIPYYEKATVVFVPVLRTGASNLKVIEAMAAGRAVVCTGKASEGLVLRPTFDVWIADDADSFTTDLLRLLRNPEILEQTRQNALQTVQSRYDWHCMESKLEAMLTFLQAVRPPSMP